MHQLVQCTRRPSNSCQVNCLQSAATYLIFCIVCVRVVRTEIENFAVFANGRENVHTTIYTVHRFAHAKMSMNYVLDWPIKENAKKSKLIKLVYGVFCVVSVSRCLSDGLSFFFLYSGVCTLSDEFICSFAAVFAM